MIIFDFNVVCIVMYIREMKGNNSYFIIFFQKK